MTGRPSDGLDDFSRRRLSDVRKRYRQLHDTHQAMARAMWIGTLVKYLDRRDIELLRADGTLCPLDLHDIGRLDRSFAEHAAIEDHGDTTRCAHCGEDLGHTRKTIDVVILGQTRRFHAARKACYKAAGWLRVGGEEAPSGGVVEFPTGEDR